MVIVRFGDCIEANQQDSVLGKGQKKVDDDGDI